MLPQRYSRFHWPHYIYGHDSLLYIWSFHAPFSLHFRERRHDAIRMPTVAITTTAHAKRFRALYQRDAFDLFRKFRCHEMPAGNNIYYYLYSNSAFLNFMAPYNIKISNASLLLFEHLRAMLSIYSLAG